MNRAVALLIGVILLVALVYSINSLITANLIRLQSGHSGDLNSDGVVNVFDLVIVGRSMNTQPGHERWNPQADVTGDGRIDLRDLNYITGKFGSVYNK
jgi:hypothetical protein